MKFDLVGRVQHNTNLPYSNCLIPLYEAIVNSIQAIATREDPNVNGSIQVKILRDNSQLTLEDPKQDPQSIPISGFKIIDNGIGFNDENLMSFETSDSSHKCDLGGKGVGRFTWLKAFDKIEVSSIFEKNGELFERSFNFVLSNDGIVDLKCIPVDSRTNLRTSVSLLGFKRKYRDKCPKNTKTIGDKIAEHCLEYFIIDACPDIVIEDEFNCRIDLNPRFNQMIVNKSRASFKCKGNDFTIDNVCIDASYMEHRIYYCAHKRPVISQPLSKHIPSLTDKKIDDGDKSFVYVGYVSGKALDQAVNTERTDFNIPKKSDGDLIDDINWEDLTRDMVKCVRTYLEPHIKEAEEENIERVKKYIRECAPKYHHLLKRPELYLSIPNGLTDEKLDSALNKIDFEVKSEIREDVRSILSKDAEFSEEYNERFPKIIEKISDVGTSQLAEYVAHRHLILELIGKSITINKNGRYPKEEIIHDIIYPMRTTSDDNNPDKQNLWIIDERLAFHRLLASDKSLSQISDSKSLLRPDIIVQNEPMLFIEGNRPFNSFVIIEFKKPMRDDMTNEKNPIAQVINLISEITEGNKCDNEGRPMCPPGEHTQFYGYIIADLTNSLIRQARFMDFRKTPDGMGMFSYNTTYNAYIEIISFDKLLIDAKKRNQVLFDKLNLPSLLF